jgi:exoribonuclease R
VADDDKRNPGGFAAVVAIADVSVSTSGRRRRLDREALRRGNSVYFP